MLPTTSCALFSFKEEPIFQRTRSLAACHTFKFPHKRQPGPIQTSRRPFGVPFLLLLPPLVTRPRLSWQPSYTNWCNCPHLPSYLSSSTVTPQQTQVTQALPSSVSCRKSPSFLLTSPFSPFSSSPSLLPYLRRPSAIPNSISVSIRESIRLSLLVVSLKVWGTAVGTKAWLDSAVRRSRRVRRTPGRG